MNELQSQADALAGQVLASSSQHTVSPPIRHLFHLSHMHLLMCLLGRNMHCIPWDRQRLCEDLQAFSGMPGPCSGCFGMLQLTLAS